MNILNLSLGRFLLISGIISITVDSRSDNSATLSRKKRYLAFPDGSVFTVVFCLTSLSRIPANTEIISQVLNWGLSWELPNANETLDYLHEYRNAAKRRNRRDLYRKVENVLTSMGYDGRSCLLKTLCEVGQKFNFKENSLLYQMINTAFRFPGGQMSSVEPEEHKIYHWASNLNTAKIIKDCSEVFQCPFSIVDFILGRYNAK